MKQCWIQQVVKHWIGKTKYCLGDRYNFIIHFASAHNSLYLQLLFQNYSITFNRKSFVSPLIWTFSSRPPIHEASVTHRHLAVVNNKFSWSHIQNFFCFPVSQVILDISVSTFTQNFANFLVFIKIEEILSMKYCFEPL